MCKCSTSVFQIPVLHKYFTVSRNHVQYDNYRIALEDEEPERFLFLAIPAQIYQTFIQEPFIQKVIDRKGIKLLVYEPFTTNLLWKK